jgi:hypothetical protein
VRLYRRHSHLERYAWRAANSLFHCAGSLIALVVYPTLLDQDLDVDDLLWLCKVTR